MSGFVSKAAFQTDSTTQQGEGRVVEFRANARFDRYPRGARLRLIQPVTAETEPIRVRWANIEWPSEWYIYSRFRRTASLCLSGRVSAARSSQLPLHDKQFTAMQWFRAAGEDLWPIISDRNGVFKLRGERSVDGDHGRGAVQQAHGLTAKDNDRLDRKGHAGF